MDIMLAILRGRVGTVAVSAALFTMLFASCLAASELPARKPACCAAMQHGCDGMSMESSCCAVSSTSAPALVPAKPAGPGQPVAVPSEATGLLAGLSVSRLPSVPAIDPSPPGVPTYLLVSSFRI